jgi:two-component system sensor histidine kinase MtrB
VVLVTRLVARPVRHAAQTAQRLSAGLLDQRMDVKGEDELALLADAFNHMAENLQRQIVRLEEMSRLQRRFTSDVSHELRTPLTTVRMAADLLYSERENFDPAVAAAPNCCRPSSTGSRSCSPTCWRSAGSTPGFAMLDVEPTDLVGWCGGHRPAHAGREAVRRRAQRHHTRAARASRRSTRGAWNACCATSWTTRSITGRASRSW